MVQFGYTYDFGDNWRHDVRVEGKRPAAAGGRYPVCTAGKRNCPPEDCGGIFGYRDPLAALADPARGEDGRLAALREEGFDPEVFSVDMADVRLRARVNGRP